MENYVHKIITYINSHFKTKIYLYFFISSIIPVLLFFTLIYPGWYNTLKAKERSFMEDKTLAINTSLDRMVSDIEKNISSIFTNTYIISTVSSEMDSVSASSFYRIATVESILKSISNYSAEGYSYTLIDYSNHVYTNGSNLNLIQDFDGPLCSEIKKSPSDETYFTVRYAYTTNKKKTITFGRPLYVNGEVKAVLIVDISPELLDSIMDAYDTQNYFTIITNSSYDLIYASKNLSPDKFKSDYKMLFTDSDAPVNLGGTLYEKVHAQAFLSHCNTYILIPESLIFQDSSRMHWRTIIIILFILIQTLTFSEIVSRTLSRHIISLKDEVIRFINTREKMNFTSRKQDEIKEIADGILYMEEEVEKLISQIKQDEEKKRHLEFKVLQQQTNPHMIYNTLNTITKLAQLQGIRNIEEVSSSFTNMLKLIAKTEGDFITIRQEINFIQNYITLKKYNSFQDFSLTLDIADSVYEQPILKLLLQPFVENSIKYGFPDITTTGNILIFITESADFIHIILEDNGCGIPKEQLAALLSSNPPQQPDAYSSTGIHNCAERLQLQYGDNHSFKMESDGISFTRVEISYLKQEEQL